MEGPLRLSPLEFAIFLTEILLPRKSNLQKARISVLLKFSIFSSGFHNSYPLLKDKIPSPSTQSVSDEELDEVEREVEDDVIQPYDSGPTPAYAFYCSEAPVSINRN